MRTEYTVTTARVAAPSTKSWRKLGIACAASGIIGVAICIFTLSYPAAVSSHQWSYPFDASTQWIVSSVLALTHALSIAGFIGVLAVAPYGRSHAARNGLWIAIVGYVGLIGCELLSGAIGTRDNKSSIAGTVSSLYGISSMVVAAGSIVAGVVIVRRLGLRNFGWSMVLWSGVLILVLVTPASISGNLVFEMAALTVWSLTFVPLGQVLIRQFPGTFPGVTGHATQVPGPLGGAGSLRR